MAVLSTGNRRNGKLEPSKSSTWKKMYEKVTITQAMEIAREKTEEWKERKATSMPLRPCCLAIGNCTSCQRLRSGQKSNLTQRFVAARIDIVTLTTSPSRELSGVSSDHSSTLQFID